MKTLAPNLFDRRFDALVEEARSRLPSLAPRWTDYNAHDPGITLLELLAYVAEAQMYSLGRMRRDEREGYAALLGLHGKGPRPAVGSLWPDPADPDSPFRSYQQPVILEADALVRMDRGDSPSFHPTHRILWTAGHVTALRTLLADGRVIDLTQVNAQGNRAFEPFGPAAGARDVLRLDYATLGERGVLPERRALAHQAYWPIGVRAAPGLRVVAGNAGDDDYDEDVTPSASPLAVDMVLEGERIEVPVVADGTGGFMRSGVLLLDFANVPENAAPVTRFALEIRAPRGFARPPRVLALEAGVLPIEQGGTERAQPHAATGAGCASALAWRRPAWLSGRTEKAANGSGSTISSTRGPPISSTNSIRKRRASTLATASTVIFPRPAARSPSTTDTAAVHRAMRRAASAGR
jgi:predicted phage baseplate assembly protein